jgi:prolyl 4-hydroxylase
VQNGGNRHTTVLIYLSDVEEGGETVFPLLPPASGQDASTLSECASKHLAVKPRKGTGKG